MFASSAGFSETTGKMKIDKPFLKMGDVFEGIIYFNPVAESARSQFYSLSGKMLGQGLYIALIKALRPNVNNVDVLELKGLFIVTKSTDLSTTQSIKLGNTSISVDVSPLKIKKIGQNKKKMIIVEQDYNSLPFTPIEKLIISLLLFIGFYLLFALIANKRRARIYEQKRLEEFETWNKIFQNAKTREEFEYIYINRESWTKIIERKTPPIIEFNRIMHMHQYKQDWTNVEKQDVEIIFDNIKRIFK